MQFLVYIFLAKNIFKIMCIPEYQLQVVKHIFVLIKYISIGDNTSWSIIMKRLWKSDVKNLLNTKNMELDFTLNEGIVRLK